MATMWTILLVSIVQLATVQATETTTTTIKPDLNELAVSPSKLVGTLAQLKLVAGYVSNMTLTAPSDGFKEVHCTVSYGAWALQIQAETERALRKAQDERRRLFAELDGVKSSLYAVLGIRNVDKQQSELERQQTVGRSLNELREFLKKAKQAADAARKALTPPTFILREMDEALQPLNQSSSLTSGQYCPAPDGVSGRADHAVQAIQLLRRARSIWQSIDALHRYLRLQLLEEDLGAELASLQTTIDDYLTVDGPISSNEFRASATPIAQRIIAQITTVRTIEEAYNAQNIHKRYARMPMITARRTDSDICRLFRKLTTETDDYCRKAIAVMSSYNSI